MIAAGIGLMFGVGASVVASIHLSQGKRKVASINITQQLLFHIAHTYPVCSVPLFYRAISQIIR